MHSSSGWSGVDRGSVRPSLDRRAGVGEPQADGLADLELFGGRRLDAESEAVDADLVVVEVAQEDRFLDATHGQRRVRRTLGTQQLHALRSHGQQYLRIARGPRLQL